MKHTSNIFLVTLLIVSLTMAATPTYAGQCSGPTRDEGVIIYNNDHHIMQYCNGTSWLEMDGGGAGGSSAIILISTQTASASASLQWTGLGNGYAYLRLICSNLVNATAGAIQKVQFGEGGTPTWETAGYSASLYALNTSGANDPFSSTNYSGFPAVNTGTTGGFTSFDMMLYQPGVSGTYKSVTYTATISLDGVSSGERVSGGGYYHGDTNPLTAIRVLPSAGNITSGQCSLYGFAQ